LTSYVLFNLWSLLLLQYILFQDLLAHCLLHSLYIAIFFEAQNTCRNHVHPVKEQLPDRFGFGLLAVQCQAMVFKNTTQVSSLTPSTTAASVTASQTAAVLNATVLDCFLQLPNDPLSAAGLSTPFLLKAPCSQAVGTQQAFAEAAIYDPATGAISIYHPLVSNEGTAPAAAPVVPTIPAGAVVGLWFGFNGGVLQLLDVNGLDANNSPVLKGADCVNGLPGVQGDVFGQVSWCNAQAWFAAANTGIASGLTVIPLSAMTNSATPVLPPAHSRL
jgi:hypothetical protein